MTDDHYVHHNPGTLASRLVLACLACRDTEPGFEASRDTFGAMIRNFLNCGCHECVSDVIADLAWLATLWATPEQEADLADSVMADLDRNPPDL